MKYVAEFDKVSREQFEKDYFAVTSIERVQSNDCAELIYDEAIALPKRATAGSAGYDFVSPISFTLNPGEEIIIPTGVRCRIDESWMLGIYPRSGLGFKYRVRLNNTVGIIDSDYFFAENEGHIMIKLTTDKPITVNAGDRIAQGIFTEYGITVDDEATGVRTGGMGSSGK